MLYKTVVTLRVKVLWWLWIKRLDAIYGNLSQDFTKLKENLLKVGEDYYTKTLDLLESNIDNLANKSRIFQKTIGIKKPRNEETAFDYRRSEYGSQIAIFVTVSMEMFEVTCSVWKVFM